MTKNFTGYYSTETGRTWITAAENVAETPASVII